MNILRLCLACTLSFLAGPAIAAEQAAVLVRSWEAKDLQHQPEACNVFLRDGFIYTGGGAPDGKIAKIKAATGAVEWVHHTRQTYQPSFPVSNGKVVVFGSYYHVDAEGKSGGKPALVGLDDQSGKVLWRVETGNQNMSAACFADDLVFAGSYDQHVYAIDWATGEVRWKTKLGGGIWSTPCVAGEDIAIGCYDGLLYLLDRKTGKVNATVDAGGRIESDPVQVGGLILLAVDGQTHKEPYSSAKLRNTMVAVDVRQRKIAFKAAAEGSLERKVVAVGDEAFYFDENTLYAFDAKAAALSWKVRAPAGLTPYPVLMADKVILPFNQMGMHGDGPAKVVILDRKTGKQLAALEQGGVGLRHANYGQSGDDIVTTQHPLTGFRLGMKD